MIMAQFLNNLLTASFHGSIVILAVIVLRLLLKRTPKKFFCMLWLLAGIRLLMPFEIQSQLSLQPEPTPVIQQIVLHEELNVVPEVLDTSLIQETVPVEWREILPEFSLSTTATEPVHPESSVTAPVEKRVTWNDLLPWIWLGVASLFLIYTLYAYTRLRLLVREAVKIEGVWECDRIDTAFILGFIKPQIYIPMGMSLMVRKHILAHEQTHIEKGDHWFKLIGFIALALHWFNPLVWIAYILLCKDIEMACDERVV